MGKEEKSTQPSEYFTPDNDQNWSLFAFIWKITYNQERCLHLPIESNIVVKVIINERKKPCRTEQ